MEALGGVYLALVVLAVIVLVLWAFLPFAVFGVKSLQQRQIELLQEQNALLRDWISRQ